MKKNLFYLSLAILVAFSFVACDNDDSNSGGDDSVNGNGCYVLNQGNWNGNDASVQFYDFETSTATSAVCTGDIFYNANGALLGDVAQDLLWINDKIFITVSTSQKLEVIDESGKRLREPYKYEEAMACPRMMTTDGNNVYVVNYDKNVYVYDVATAEFIKKIPVGSYPEGISYIDGYLVVSNSDYGMGNASVSVIDVNSGETREIRDYIYNPGTQSVVCNGDVYVADQGNYSTIGANIIRISPQEATAESLNVPASLLATYEGYIYYVNASWSYAVNGYEYSPLYRRDVVTGEVVEVLPKEKMTNIYSLSVNPENGDIFIGYADGTNLGVMRVYSADGVQKGVFDIGIFTAGARFEQF